MAPTGSSQHANFLLTTIHVVRLISPLLRTLQSPIISALTLSMFDSHFASCMEAFPPNCHINSQHPIEPRHLHPICHLQNARLVLHRHNLSTSCSVDIRTTALDSCVSAAKDTVHLLSRAIQWQPSDNMNKQEGQHGTWQQMLAQSATAMLCTHIWRCTLFLLFRGLYSEALVCVQFSSVIGEAREVNMACGRYLFGFLHALNDKLQRQERLENDEGMLALVSGDVQGSTESSWVWTGSETGSALQNAASAANDPHKDHQQASYESSVRLLPEEANDWGGWQNIELMINQLIQKNYPHPPPLSVSAMASNVSGRLTPAAPPMQSSTSRISIANII